jgi:hypothetical protein
VPDTLCRTLGHLCFFSRVHQARVVALWKVGVTECNFCYQLIVEDMCVLEVSLLIEIRGDIVSLSSVSKSRNNASCCFTLLKGEK